MVTKTSPEIGTLTINYMNIGSAMKRIREQSGIGRPEMAKRLSVTQSALWKIEAGKTFPKRKTLDKFCEETRISLALLYVKALEESDFVVHE